MRAAVAAALVGAASAQWAQSKCAGALSVNVEGSVQQWAVATFTWAGTTANGNSVTLRKNDRAYIVQACQSSFSAGMYTNKFALLGKTLSYTMNLATAGCGCNAAIYGVSMPARNSAGAVIPSGNGDGYCDANWVGGAACPEMDWMEANTAAWSTTPHTCVASANGYYGSCDGGGCGRYAYKNLGPSAYGYGAGYTIDTSQVFNVAISFVPDAGGTLQSIITLLTQGTRSISLVHDSTTCAAGYLATMSASIAAGMVPTLSLW